jgi:serine/threonine protein kinase
MTNKIADFEIGKTIGTGTFSKVKKALHVPSGETVSVKIL